jgi:AcrR family transcriptional regulator
MQANVGDDNNDVNAYIRAWAEIACGVMPPYHHGNLRTVLLEHAERTLQKQGVGALSLRELARSAGVSHGAPRRHFADREALLDALAERGYERLGTELSAALDSAAPSLEARVTALARAYAGFVTSSGELLALMFAGKRADPDGSVHRASEAAIGPWQKAFLEAGPDEGIVGDVTALGMAVFSAVHGLAVLVNANIAPVDGLDAAVTDMARRILRGSRTLVPPDERDLARLDK